MGLSLSGTQAKSSGMGLWRLRVVFGDPIPQQPLGRWARSFATLWNCGIPISTALEVSSQSALNARYAHALRRAARETRQGISLRDSLSSTLLLPNYLLDVIGTGELSGNLGASLDHFASLLEEEAFARATQQFVTLLLVGQILGALLLLLRVFP